MMKADTVTGLLEQEVLRLPDGTGYILIVVDIEGQASARSNLDEEDVRDVLEVMFEARRASAQREDAE